MVAAPFTGVIVVKYQDGYQESINFTASDVTTENWLGPDGTAYIKLSGGHGNCYIRDIILSAAGTDTRTSTIDVNGKRIPMIVVHGANVGTVFARQLQTSPLPLPQGATIEFTQVT